MRSLPGLFLLPGNSGRRLARALLATALAFSLGACGLLPEVKDETAGWSAAKIYGEAHDAMTDGAFDKAVKLFEKLEARYPYGRYAEQAQVEVAYAYYKQNEMASAIAACDRFIKLHPNHLNADYMYYLKGLVSFNEDLGIMARISNQDPTERDPKGMRDSFNAFKELTSRFPNSKYYDDSVQRMQYLVNAMAAHELHVARYYMRRGAPLAAANRAQGVVKNFANTPQVEEALFTMMLAYEQLNLPDLRKDAERVLRQNFPQSDYLNGKARSLDTPWWQLW